MRKSFLFLAGFIFQSLLYSQQVLDKESALPISGVKITLGSSSELINYTDTFGGFSLRKGLSNETIICFQKEFYEPTCMRVDEISKLAYIYLSKSQVNLEGVVVRSIRQNINPTNTNYNLNEIKQLNNIRDIPMMLSLTPNAVSTSDAGNGVGYTGLRIRGVDPTRTNITINGIPLNDAESQGVYFVNMPDFASNLASIQIQRGLGNSTNGAGAFGSTINMQTNEAQEKPSSSFSLGGGYIMPEKAPYTPYSGNRTSALSNVLINTGNINHWYITGRLSYIKSDGYVERSQSQLQSYYLSMVKKYKKSLIKILNFSGREKTGQAWNGIPEEILFSTHSFAYQPNRVYNVFTYPNQTDNYTQSHYQIHFNHEFNKNSLFHIALHYTKGKGFYEEHKKDQDLATYQISLDTSIHITTTDLIRRRWLDNQFYGMIFSHIYTHGKWKMVTGGGINQYKGKHLGEVIWARYSGSSEINQPYYSGVSDKVDLNIYEKINYDINSKVQVWLDLQARNITYKTNGTNDYSGYIIPYQVSKSYMFFNPKIGMTYRTASTGVYNFYAGIGNREPVRDDMINSSQKSEPKSEKLYDIELSHAIRFGAVNLQSNVYMMYYQNQLINDGSINDVGAYNRINVPQSYRAGLELSVLYQISKKFHWNFNIGLSQNKILNFKEYIDSYDTAWNYLGNSLNKEYKSVEIAFSPNTVASSILTFKVTNHLKMAWIGKYVSTQFLDNTGSEARRIKPYQLNDLQLTYAVKTKLIGLVQLNLLCNNVLNLKYENNGYTYSSLYGKNRVDYNSYYPSAGTNFMLKLTCDF